MKLSTAIQVLIISLVSVCSYSRVPVDSHIKTDQFGYRRTDRKVAVISNPVAGYNSNDPFTPGLNYHVKRIYDDVSVFSGQITAWNSGATHTQSGDKVWWFDFSQLTTPGDYYIYDSERNVRSYTFEIRDNILEGVLISAVRAFYYQRCGTAKSDPYAHTGWTDDACHLHPLQDTDCRLYNNNSPSTSRNLYGGWHDAGDYNKYVNFTFDAMLDLLFAYSENPGIWSDNNMIPESGNGIPDILDEAKYELDWLLRMQSANGSVLSIVGVQNFATASPPSDDFSQRLYGPATTSATMTASALFAFAAIQFNHAGQSDYAQTLQSASVNAWNWASSNPGVTFYNTGIIGAGEQEVDNYGRLVRKMASACFLYALTGGSAYKTFFESNYTQMHLIQWGYAYPFETSQQDMLLYYASLPGSSSSVSAAIKNAYRISMSANNPDNLPAYINGADAYRSYISNQNYTWGSNTTKARQGNMFRNMITYKLDTLNKENYMNAARGFVDYFHGVNPTGFSYITNMNVHGAENSVNEVYHAWFTDGSALWDRVGVSVFGPVPGLVPGGVNPTYSLDGCCPSGCSPYNDLCNPTLVTPPLNQPVQKSYRDWNTSWPQNSWTITEPGIYTQAAYARLLSGFIEPSSIRQIRVCLEGMYDPQINRTRMRDTITLEVKSTVPPYTTQMTTRSLLDSVTLTATFSFQYLANGTYYLAVKHRNSVEVWSKPGGEVIDNQLSFHYDFTEDSSKAYGENLTLIDSSPVTFAMYSGDVNQDGTVDAGDLALADNDASAFATGYIPSDVTGDFSTDATDLALIDNNASLYVSKVVP